MTPPSQASGKQYLRLRTRCMTTRTHVAVFTATAAICLASTASAMAGPAGSEYLPALPKGSGKTQSNAASSFAPGSAGYTGGSSSSQSSNGTSTGTSGGGGHGNGRAAHKHVAKPAPVSKIAPATEGSGGTPWIAVGLLVVAGSATVAAGLVLRRRTT